MSFSLARLDCWHLRFRLDRSIAISNPCSFSRNKKTVAPLLLSSSSFPPFLLNWLCLSFLGGNSSSQNIIRSKYRRRNRKSGSIDQGVCLCIIWNGSTHTAIRNGTEWNLFCPLWPCPTRLDNGVFLIRAIVSCTRLGSVTKTTRNHSVM